MRNYCQRNVDPAEAIAVLMEISDVSKRLACNLAKLADQENVKGGNENEENSFDIFNVFTYAFLCRLRYS